MKPRSSVIRVCIKTLGVSGINQAHHSTGTNKTRVVKRTVPAETFFNFFSPPVFPGEDEELDEEEAEGLDAKLEADYEMGEEFKDKIIPHAVDYFTGKALEYEDFEGDDDFEVCGSHDTIKRIIHLFFLQDDFYDDDDDEEDDDEDDDDDDDDDATVSIHGWDGHISYVWKLITSFLYIACQQGRECT